jgi:hypothetical protein
MWAPEEKRQGEKLKCVQWGQPKAASDRQAGAQTDGFRFKKAWEERDAQLVCSTGDERAFGFAAVRAAE